MNSTATWKRLGLAIRIPVEMALYADILGASDSGLTNLLNHDLIDLRRNFNASSSTICTWQVSFDRIRVQNPRAAERLSLLDRQGFCAEMMRNKLRSLLLEGHCKHSP